MDNLKYQNVEMRESGVREETVKERVVCICGGKGEYGRK
jgi:hypothetical protein